ncbi:FecR domain-containing protein [Bradyrhizobium sp. dw_411]|uniref:FecR family protein n=1 Tax=Bradyrhizobium sp. dw_411 TaxID=2720082 RepID=UPI00201C8E46|nr:FecR domain-containing protein [Bradyrhizobium sp. dw_411]
MTRHRFSFAIWLVCCLVLAGPTNGWAQAQPAPTAAPPASAPVAPSPAAPAAAQPAAAPPQAPAQDSSQDPANEPIGNVATLTGNATVTRNNVPTPLKLKDDIFLNDALNTSANSKLGVTFNDGTTFNLTANAQITVDNYVYQDGGQQNAALFDITRGTVAFVAAAVAKTGDMKISTPSAALGIRGTTGLVEVPQGASANNPNNVAIKLYPDPDGRVGHIDVSDRAGTRLGSLTQGASGFTIRAGAGGRFTAAPLMISPQQMARDQGIVRQVHAAQAVGRQIVTQQRALRQANPNRNNLRNNPARPGPQRQNNLAPRPGSPQQPGRQGQAQPTQPNRQIQQPQPRQPGQPGQPAQLQRPGQPAQLQRPPGAPAAPAIARPGVPNKPAVQRLAPPRKPPPKEKKR